MPVIVPIPKSAFIVTISGMETIWTQFSGIVDTAESGQYANGTGRRIYKVVGPRALDDVTLTAPYDPVLAHAIEQIWSDYNCEFITIVIQPTTCNGESSNSTPYVLNGCQLTSLTVAEMDRESGDVGTIELVFTVNSWNYS
jgi:hypothetical protein